MYRDLSSRIKISLLHSASEAGCLSLAEVCSDGFLRDSLRLSSTNTFQAPVKVYVIDICTAETFSLFNQGLLASCPRCM